MSPPCLSSNCRLICQHTSDLHWWKPCLSVAAVCLDPSFVSIPCTLYSCPFGPVASYESLCQALWWHCTVCIACTMLGVSASATILPSQTLARAVHSTRSPVGVGWVYPIRICRRAASLKDAASLGFCWPFRSLRTRLPELGNLVWWPPPFQSAPLPSATRLLPFWRSLYPCCAYWLLPIHQVVFLSPLLFWLGDSCQALQYCKFHARRLPPSPILELDLERGSQPISNASRQRAEKAGGQRASWPVGHLTY